MCGGIFASVARSKRGISPIIATLLLILIAIASGVILYSYVTGFIGSSTQNPGLSISTISIDNACVSISTTHCSGSQYSITIRNLGASTISYANSATAQIYFTDISTTTTSSTTCTISSSIAPGGTLTCPVTTGTNLPAGFSPSSGDTVSIKVVMPDGGSAISTAKVIS